MIYNILIFLAMLHLLLAWDPPSYNFNILVVVPGVDTTSSNTNIQSPPEQSWQKSEELFAAAEHARRSVSQLCLPFSFSMTELRTDCTSADLQIVRELTAADGRITVAVIGYFTKKVSRALRITSPDRLGLVQIALNTHANEDKKNWLYQMLPSTRVYAEALTQFITHVGWTRIAVAFTQTQNSYSLEMAEQVIGRLQDKGFEPFVIEISYNGIAAQREHILMNAIKQIYFSGTKIIYILLPPIETTQLICRAYDYGLRWLDYGWIVPDVSLEDVLSLNSSGDCDPNAVEGIFSFHMTNEANISEVETMKTYNNCPEESATLEVLPSNIYANTIYDSILATALSLNQTFDEVREYLAGQSSNSYTQSYKLEVQKRVSQIIGENFVNVSFVGTLGEVTLNRSEVITETHIVIYQNNGDGSLKKLAEYNPHTNTTNFENYSTSHIPNDTIMLSRVYILPPLVMEVVLMTGIVLFSLLTLLNMILYIYYRNSPEMKATSVKLSMMIYLSSFAMYFGCGMDTYWNINKVADNEYGMACLIIVWPVYLGGDTILATFLVKICRVHRIFKNLFEKVKFCSDCILFLLIILIVFVKVVCLAVWTAVDRLVIIDVETYHPEGKPPYYEVSQHCYSDYTYIWVSILLVYAVPLGGVLAFMAFKTRKIKRKDFKDTKKINALMVSWFYAITILVPLWGILRSTGNAQMSKILITLLLLLLPVSCQLYLFCPKTLPPLERSLWKHFPNIKFSSKKETTPMKI